MKEAVSRIFAPLFAYGSEPRALKVALLYRKIDTMQGKGVVRFFLILLAIICVYQLLFFVPANRVEGDAVSFAEQRTTGIQDEAVRIQSYNDARRAYLDSMSNEKVWSLLGVRDFTYSDVKQQQVALGLDLKGGMSVVMQVDLRGFIETMSDNSSDPTLVAALDAADKELASAQSDYITLFVDNFLAIAPEGKSLASIFSQSEALRDQVNFQSSNGEVATILRTEADETVDLTYSLLKERIDRMGVLQPNVSLDDSRDLIVVELPGVDNPQRAREFLQAAAALDFYDVYRNNAPGIFQGLINANDALTSAAGGSTDIEEEIQSIEPRYAIDDLGNADTTQILGYDTTYVNNAANLGVLFSKLRVFNPSQGATAVIGYTDRSSKDDLIKIFQDPAFLSNFPQDIQFAVGQKPIRDQSTREFTEDYAVYALRKEANGEPTLSGAHIVEAGQSVDVGGSGEVEVNITMDQEGARKWAEVTTANVGKEFAIVLDGEVVSAPVINQAITGGRSRITGGFSIQEAQDLAAKLEVGRLPTVPRIIQESIVGPSLGADNIASSTWALIIGFGLVLLFMVLYYGGSGIVSIIALLANVFFIFGALSSFGTVLTLPGIAGIVLTIGMAVDANVIIYERIREEIRAGKGTLMAIKDGFNASYSAIIDANVTTLLTALVLNYWGLGPIKGFAVVLMIGIFTSLFTAVLVTRLIIDWRTSGGKDLSFSTGFSEKILSNVNVDWMGKRKIGYTISTVLIIISLGSIFTRGFDLGVDFTGGYTYTVAFEGTDVQRDALEAALLPAFENESTVVKAVDASNTFNVTTSYQVNNPDTSASRLVEQALFAGVSQVQPGLNFANFKLADLESSTRIISSTKVGPTIADDIRNSSFKSGVFALILIFLYLFIRFSRWEFSAGAVAALFHDVIITLGLFSLFHGVLPFSMEIDQAFVAAILTVIGYSVNDTVVVFDRIREFIGTYTGRTKEEIFNLAINSTLSRTLITSLTTLFVVLILFVFGGGSIKGFAFALLIGILVGTYSSIFVASATVNDLVKDIKVRKTVTRTTSESSKAFGRAAAARSEAQAGA